MVIQVAKVAFKNVELGYLRFQNFFVTLNNLFSKATSATRVTLATSVTFSRNVHANTRVIYTYALDSMKYLYLLVVTQLKCIYALAVVTTKCAEVTLLWPEQCLWKMDLFCSRT